MQNICSETQKTPSKRYVIENKLQNFNKLGKHRERSNNLINLDKAIFYFIFSDV